MNPKITLKTHGTPSNPNYKPPEIIVGKHTYTSNLAVLALDNPSLASLTIGSFCSFASDVKIMLVAEHRIDWVTAFPFTEKWDQAKNFTGHPTSKGNVVIGNDVWIAQEAVILSGITIGDGAVIGARSMVTKDVPPYGIVAGNPAKLIKKRFDDTTIERLVSIKWWKWNDSEVADALPLLLSNDIEKFLDYAEAKIK